MVSINLTLKFFINKASIVSIGAFLFVSTHITVAQSDLFEGIQLSLNEEPRFTGRVDI